MFLVFSNLQEPFRRYMSPATLKGPPAAAPGLSGAAAARPGRRERRCAQPRKRGPHASGAARNRCATSPEMQLEGDALEPVPLPSLNLPPILVCLPPSAPCCRAAQGNTGAASVTSLTPGSPATCVCEQRPQVRAWRSPAHCAASAAATTAAAAPSGCPSASRRSNSRSAAPARSDPNSAPGPAPRAGAAAASAAGAPAAAAGCAPSCGAPEWSPVSCTGL